MKFYVVAIKLKIIKIQKIQFLNQLINASFATKSPISRTFGDFLVSQEVPEVYMYMCLKLLT